MRLALAAWAALLAPGCVGTWSVPVEVSHLSHISQHFHPPADGMHGSNAISTGLRYREGYMTVDVLDGWTDGIDGLHEVFQARITAEIPLSRGNP